jgi:hypothetical protein
VREQETLYTFTEMKRSQRHQQLTLQFQLALADKLDTKQQNEGARPNAIVTNNSNVVALV